MKKIFLLSSLTLLVACVQKTKTPTSLDTASTNPDQIQQIMNYGL